MNAIIEVGTAKGRISEAHVQAAIARESALIQYHRRLIQTITKRLQSHREDLALNVHISEMLKGVSDYGMGILSRWEQLEFEANFYADAAYEITDCRESVVQYVKDAIENDKGDAVEAARLITLASLCSHGIQPNHLHAWLKA